MPKAAQSTKSKAVKSTKPTKSVKATKKAASKKKSENKLIKNKPYIEFLTAFLSIPVLITVMLLNFNTLKNLNAKPTPTPAPGATVQSGFFAEPIGAEDPATPTPLGATEAPCLKGLGPVSIATPEENDAVADNPVTVDINYDDNRYCEAAWSYRINGGSWSGYDDRSVALYNLPQGNIKFELRVRSIAGDDNKTVTRNFTYTGKGTILIPTSQTGSESAR
jgi:hypothetical protein